MNRVITTGLLSAIVVLSAAGGVVCLAEPSAPTSVNGAELQRWALQLRLMPETLAVAGLSASEASAVAGAFRQHMATNRSAIQAASQQLQEAKAQLRKLQARAMGGRGSAADQSALSDAQSAAQQKQEAYDALIEQARSTSIEPLGVSARDRLVRVCRNFRTDLPVYYAVMDVGPDELTALAHAYRVVKMAQASQSTPPSDEAMQIAQADTRIEVVAAKQALLQNLDGIDSAWKSSLE